MATAPALPPCRVQGLTLIELLVTITILVMLLMAAVPFTLDWGHSAKTLEAKGTLVQAYSHAKALALRNPCQEPALNSGTNSPTPAANLQIEINSSTKTLNVLSACSTVPVWSATLPAQIKILRNDSELTSTVTLDIDNRGMPIGTTAFKLRRGGDQNDESITLY